VSAAGVLVDTSAWIELLRDTKSSAARELERLITDNAPIFTTGVVVAELLRGCDTERDAAGLAESLHEWPALEPRYPQTYEHAARLARDARRAGKAVRSTIDCLLAALAIENKLAVLHHDRDFERLSQMSKLRLVATD